MFYLLDFFERLGLLAILGTYLPRKYVYLHIYTLIYYSFIPSVLFLLFISTRFSFLLLLLYFIHWLPFRFRWPVCASLLRRFWSKCLIVFRSVSISFEPEIEASVSVMRATVYRTLNRRTPPSFFKIHFFPCFQKLSFTYLFSNFFTLLMRFLFLGGFWG